MSTYGLRLSEIQLHASSASLFGGIEIGGSITLDASYFGNFRQLTLMSYAVKLRLIAPGRGELLLGTALSSSGAGAVFAPHRQMSTSLSDTHIGLTIHALERIEQLRNAKDLHFKVNVQCLFLGVPGSGGETQVTSYYGESELQIPRSAWVEKFLRAWGFQDLEIWEIRGMNARPDAGLKREYDRLSKAVRMLDQGEWDAAHKECRESIDAIISQWKQLPATSKPDKKVVDRLHSYLSLAVHLETGPDEDWHPNRNDAILAISLTKAILDRVSASLSLERSN